MRKNKYKFFAFLAANSTLGLLEKYKDKKLGCSKNKDSINGALFVCLASSDELSTFCCQQKKQKENLI